MRGGRGDGTYVAVHTAAARAGEPIEVEYDLPGRTMVETMPVNAQ